MVNGSKCLSVRANLLKVILVFHNKWLSYNLYIISIVSIKDTDNILPFQYDNVEISYLLRTQCPLFLLKKIEKYDNIKLGEII